MSSHRYAWVITRDHLAEPGQPEGTSINAVGVIGPRGAFLATREDIERHPNARAFRLKDDDGELYYTGVIAFENAADIGSELAFAPLDDYGAPNAGATSIEYRDQQSNWHAL